MIDFTKYTQSYIQQDMLKQVPSDLDTREGSMIQTAISPVAWYLEGTYMQLGQLQQNAYAGTAVGESLDKIVASRGIKRKQATPAIRQGTVNISVPKGSAFKTINGPDSVIFVSGDLILQSSEGYIYQLTCLTGGIIGNSYSGNLLPITAISGLTSATIGEIITPGSEEESDEPLRARYFATFDVPSFGGNITSYRNEILSIEGVGAVQIYPAYQGGGTVLCSILDSELTPAEPGLITKVQNIICPPEEDGTQPSPNGYGMAPIGAAVTITTASNLTLDISCDIQFSATVEAGVVTFRNEIEEKIQEYLDTVCQLWGEPLKRHTIEYVVPVYISRIVAAILTIPEIVNVSNVKINNSPDDLVLTETAQMQQIPSLGAVIINGG